VAVQKARTAVFFSATNRAYSARTVGFLAQNSFPPGITGTAPGLFLRIAGTVFHHHAADADRGDESVNGACSRPRRT